MSSADCKTLLQKCADYYDQQSAQLAQDLTKTSAQKNTLQNAISKLKNKIQGLEADINQGNIMVKDLNMQISDTQISIDKTTAANSGFAKSNSNYFKVCLRGRSKAIICYFA